MTMDMGNAKLEPVWSVDYDWVDERVRKYLGIPDFEFLAAMESSNDTVHEFNVTHPYINYLGLFDDRYKTWHDEDVAHAQDGEWSFKVTALMNELHRLGHIESGTYMVRVCW